MPAIDRINRRGIDGRRVLLGPARLGRPRPQGTSSAVGRVVRVTGSNDQYEITTNGTGISAVAYTAVVRPYVENGLRASTSKLGTIALIRQVDGLNTATAGMTCIGAKRHASTTSTTSLGPFTVNANDRLWIVIEEQGCSTVKYQLELSADFITIGTQPANSSVTAPAAASFTVAATTNDGGSLSYQWQISTDGGTTWGNVTNGGVYSGATTVTLAISNSTGLNTRRYRCLVSSTLTAPTATSNSALLTVA
jgi:hypothetical protein